MPLKDEWVEPSPLWKFHKFNNEQLIENQRQSPLHFRMAPSGKAGIIRPNAVPAQHHADVALAASGRPLGGPAQ